MDTPARSGLHRWTTRGLMFAAAMMAILSMAVFVRLALAPARVSAALLLTYLSVPTLLAIACGVLSRRSADTQLSFVVSMIALSATLLAFELRLETNDPVQSERDRVARSARAAGHQADARSALAFVDSMRVAGDTAYPAMYGSAIAVGRLGDMSLTFIEDHDTTLVLASVADRMTVYCNESGTYVTYRTDSLGFDNRNAWWDDGALDAVIVGDSYAAGACVPGDSNLVAWLRRAGLRTVGLGVGGSGPIAELARLREYAAPRAPRLVLWIFTEANDLENLSTELRSPILRRYTDPSYSQHLAAKHRLLEPAYIARFDSALADHGRGLGLRRSRADRLRSVNLRDVLTLQFLRSALGLPSLNASAPAECCVIPTWDFTAFRAILGDADREVTSWGGRLVFVVIPDNSHLIDRTGEVCRPCATTPELDSLNATRHRTVGIAQSLGIELIDLHETLLAQGDLAALLPKAGGHYSAAGYRVIADAIMAHLGRAGLARPRGGGAVLTSGR